MALAAAPAGAEVCDKLRPFVTPGNATGATELAAFLASPAGIGLVALAAVAMAARSRRLAYVSIGATAVWMGQRALFGPAAGDGIGMMARAEGCIGPAHLVFGMCVLLLAASARVLVTNRPGGVRP